MSERKIQEICEAFKESGDCPPPLPSADVDKLVAPEVLKELLRHAREWHICKDHYDVFGLNMFTGKQDPFFNKAQIMGDAELVEEWKTRHASPNCAHDGWECFLISSEFDYIFVCVDPTDEQHFGATRRIVNNCFEDKEFTPAPFEVFIDILVDFTTAYREFDTSDAEDDDERPEFVNFVVDRARR